MTVMLSVSAAPAQAPAAKGDRGAKAGAAQDGGFANALSPSRGEPRRNGGKDQLPEGEAGAQAKLNERLSALSRQSEAEKKTAEDGLKLPAGETEADALPEDAELLAAEMAMPARGDIVVPTPAAAGSATPAGASASAAATEGIMPTAGGDAAGKQPLPQAAAAQAGQMPQQAGTTRPGEPASPANAQPRADAAATAAATRGGMTDPAAVAAVRPPVVATGRNAAAGPVTVVEPETMPAGDRPSATTRQLSSTLGAAAVGKPADAVPASELGGPRIGGAPQPQQAGGATELTPRGANAPAEQPAFAVDKQSTLARGTATPAVSAKGGQEAGQPAASATPAQPASPAQAVLSALRADPELRAGPAEATVLPGQQNFAAPAGPRSLKIQLHPAELGMVTARLAKQGAQLSIELQVESDEARQRLSTESDAIMKALRGLGFEVDRVTIQQASPTPPSNGQQPGSASRDGAFQGMGNGDKGAEGRSSDGRSGAQTGGGHGNGGREKPGAASRDGIYI